jgi:serine/threonine protein kinase
LARGIEFISKNNVVHRDIKPDNIFLKKEGQSILYKLGDFGFAVKKQINEEIVGTPIFMSPEIFKEESYGSEVDVWAFGLLVHYMLFKEYYFIAASESQIKKRVLS